MLTGIKTGIRRGLKMAALAATAIAMTVAVQAPAKADAGDLQVRLRGLGIIPTGESGGIQPALGGASLRAKPNAIPELDLTYFVTDNIGVELILGTSRHQVKGQGAIAGLGNVADVWLLPPTLTLQYHFQPEAAFRPYVGAGINYTFFYGEDADGSLVNAIGATKVQATNSLGLALQAGFDYDLGNNWVVNFDLKYIRLDTNVFLENAIGTQRTDLDINPLIIGVGVGYRFNLL